jgi:O-antigen/teichoic acid export membrane protein
MGIVVRQSILTSIISYAGIVIGYINLLYLYPKFLHQEQLGLLRAIQDAAMLMAPFATLGLAQGILRFFPQYMHKDKERKKFVSLIVMLGFFSFTLFLIAFNIFEEQLLGFFEKNARILVRYKNVALALTLALVFITIFEQFAKSIMQIALPNFLREVGIRFLQALLVIAFFYALLDFQQFIVGSVIIYFVSLAVLLIFLLRMTIGFDFEAVRTFSWPRIREILAFSSLSFVSVSAMILIGKMDSLMVTGFLGLSSVAVYSTAYYMATVIEIPKRAITQTTTTLIARAFERNDLSEVESLYRKTAINQLAIGALLLLGIWANLQNIFQLMPNGEDYRAGALVVILIGIGKLIDMAFGPSSEIIGLSKYYWFNLVCVTALAIIVIIANYFFIPRYGINGAAYGSVAALIIYNLVKFIFILLKLRLQPFTVGTVKVGLITAAVALLNYFLPAVDNVFIDIGYRSIIITVSFSLLILLSRSSDEINKAFWSAVRYGTSLIKRQDH